MCWFEAMRLWEVVGCHRNYGGGLLCAFSIRYEMARRATIRAWSDDSSHLRYRYTCGSQSSLVALVIVVAEITGADFEVNALRGKNAHR